MSMPVAIGNYSDTLEINGVDTYQEYVTMQEKRDSELFKAKTIEEPVENWDDNDEAIHSNEMMCQGFEERAYPADGNF